MNIIRKIAVFALIATSFAAISCNKDDMPQPKPVYLEVNANNISGKWQLAQWNESALAEGTYLYLEIVRNDRTYTMYQNFDSFHNIPHVVTGSYRIDTDPEFGAVIRGSYDHDSGEWAHRYVIKDLTADEMTWVAKDDSGFVQKFVRIDSIPVQD